MPASPSSASSPRPPRIPPAAQFFFFLLPPLLAIVLPFLVPVPEPQLINGDSVPTNARVALLIAHPDDEAMFFGPTLLELADHARGNQLSILCLSDGNAAGLGPVRRDELHASAGRLGIGLDAAIEPVRPGEVPLPDQLPIPNPAVTIVGDPARFPDDMHKSWNASDVADALWGRYVTARPPLIQEQQQHGGGGILGWLKRTRTPDPAAAADMSADPRVAAQTTCDIDYLITFDEHGVSSHPNHVSLNHGAKEFIARLQRQQQHASPIPQLYTLTSVSLPRKYSGLLDVLMTRYLLGADARAALRREKKRMETSRQVEEGEGGEKVVAGWIEDHWDAGLPRVLAAHAATRDGLELVEGDALYFQNDVPRYRRTREAMLLAHRSQMAWFRHGWIALGRYMYVNDLRRWEAR